MALVAHVLTAGGAILILGLPRSGQLRDEGRGRFTSHLDDIAVGCAVLARDADKYSRGNGGEPPAQGPRVLRVSAMNSTRD